MRDGCHETEVLKASWGWHGVERDLVASGFRVLGFEFGVTVLGFGGGLESQEAVGW